MVIQKQDVEYHDHVRLEDFPLEEIRNHVQQMKLIGHLETSAIESAICGWTRFIAPFTPPHCFTVSPSSVILDFVSSSLVEMSFHDLQPRFRMGHPIFAELHVKMLPLWPTIWTWLQILHHDKHMCASHGVPEISISFRMRQCRYEAMCGILRSFLYSDAQTALSATVLRTEGVMTMAAELWIEEARDKQAVFGFEMGKILRIPAWTSEDNADISVDFLSHIVTGCGGSKDEVVKLLYRRIKTNLLQLEPEIRTLLCDLTMAACRIHDNTGTPILRDALLSNARYAMIFMVDVVSLLLKAQMREVTNQELRPLDIAHSALALILSLVGSSRAYECISQMLDTTFFTVVSRVSLAFEDGKNDNFESTLNAMLIRISFFAAHRNLLTKMKRSIGVASKSARTNMAIAKFKLHLEAWSDMNKEIKDVVGPCQTICGDPQCVAFDFMGELRRCSGCFFICYCSRACQKRHWRGEHKKLCHNMRHSVKGLVGLSGANLRLLAYAISWDARLPAQRLNPYSWDGTPREGAPASSHSVVLDYYVEGSRVNQGVLDLRNLAVTPMPPTSVHPLSMLPIPMPAWMLPMERKFSSRLPELKDVLQRHWAVSNDLPNAAEKRMFTPVLALVPRGGENVEEDSQVIAAMLVETQIQPVTGESVPRTTGRYVRWLYCI